MTIRTKKALIYFLGLIQIGASYFVIGFENLRIFLGVILISGAVYCVLDVFTMADDE